jgi:hypothetical protein
MSFLRLNGKRFHQRKCVPAARDHDHIAGLDVRRHGHDLSCQLIELIVARNRGGQ